MLDRQIKVLKSEGIHRIILIGGYRSEMLCREDAELRINPAYSETNMVYTLFCAESDLDDEAIVSYGDIVYSRAILSKLLKSDADIAVTIDKDWKSYWFARSNNPLDDAETLQLSSEGRITEIGRKPNTMEEIEGQYMGLMKFSAKGAAMMSKVYHEAKKAGNLCGKPVKKAQLTDLLQTMIHSGYRVDAVTVQGGWVEVDTISDLFLDVTKERLRLIKNSIKQLSKHLSL